MIRLTNESLGVTVVVPNDKAIRLTADGTYKPVPDTEQLSPEESEELDRAAAEAKAALRRRGANTNISDAINGAVPENRYEFV